MMARLDVARIEQLTQLLPADQYAACLSNEVHQLVARALVGDVTIAGGHRDCHR
jgi:hypothetical protein